MKIPNGASQQSKAIKFILTGESGRYKPNFNDPRVLRRIKSALGFAAAYTNPTTPKHISSVWMAKFTGYYGFHLGKYLRDKLLICTNNFYNKDNGTCKQYIMNVAGFKELKSIIKPEKTKKKSVKLEKSDYDFGLDFLKEKYGAEIQSGNFHYKHKSNRFWNNIQNIPKKMKLELLATYGYTNHYDIVSCAPTLIHQYAQSLGMEEYLFTMREYLANPKKFRNQLAEQIDCDTTAAKKIITALFAGARVSYYSESAIMELVGESGVGKLKKIQWVSDLQKDIKTCWEYIVSGSAMKRRTNKLNKLIPITSAEKWNVYFQLESRINQVVSEYLTSLCIVHFMEHDGWSTVVPLDMDSLVKVINDNSGFKVKLSHGVPPQDTTKQPSLSDIQVLAGCVITRSGSHSASFNSLVISSLLGNQAEKSKKQKRGRLRTSITGTFKYRPSL